MSESLQKIERKQYSPELKAEAVSLVLEHGYSCGAAGQKLGVPAKTLANWVRPRRRQELDFPTNGGRGVVTHSVR